MEDVPDNIGARRAVLYQIYYRRGQGLAVEDICRDLDISASTFYSYQRIYPIWMSEINKQAVQDLIEDIRDEEHRLLAAKTEAQVRISEVVLPRLITLYDQISDQATGEGMTLSTKMKAAKLLSDMLKEGATVSPVEPDETVTVEKLLQPISVDLLALTGRSIKLSDGREVQLGDQGEGDTESDVPHSSS
jgi:hypothetical protein